MLKHYIVKALCINLITTIFDSIFVLYHKSTESRKMKSNQNWSIVELVMINISC